MPSKIMHLACKIFTLIRNDRVAHIFYALLIAFHLLACAENSLPCNHYVTERPSKWDIWRYELQGYEGYTSGTSLSLNEDSTFIMTTCGNIASGRWVDHGSYISLYAEPGYFKGFSIIIPYTEDSVNYFVQKALPND